MIVVGVDGSPAALAAVDLGAREAVLRYRALRLVHVDSGRPDVLWTALERARLAGEVPVTADVLAGDPAEALIRESALAELVVVGHRGRGGFAGLLVGSVATSVAAHARCPVVVVRGPAPAAGYVVVGVDGAPGTEAAVGFACKEAALREAPLLAVHAWSGPAILGPSDLLIYDPVADQDVRARLLANLLAPWQEKYPEVSVHRRVRWDRPARALLEAATEAQLIVVGTRGHGVPPGLRLGSVTYALLHHAGCPVAVVPRIAGG